MKRPFLLRRPLAAAALCGPLVLLTSATASASGNYPEVVKGYFELDTAPKAGCAFCHDNPGGGPGKINDAVGKYLTTKLALQPRLDKAGLEKILEKWDEKQDSDGDGAFDIDEVKAGNDPNDEDDKPKAGGAGGAGGSSDKGGSGGSSTKDDDDDDDKKGSGGGTNNGLTGQATSAGCSLAGPPGGTAAGSLALAGLAALLARAASGRKGRKG